MCMCLCVCVCVCGSEGSRENVVKLSKQRGRRGCDEEGRKEKITMHEKVGYEEIGKKILNRGRNRREEMREL